MSWHLCIGKLYIVDLFFRVCLQKQVLFIIAVEGAKITYKDDMILTLLLQLICLSTLTFIALKP